jgi:hypothetical protein
MTTAVEWQYIELSKFINGKSEFTDANDILIKAQEMEKEQQIEFACQVYDKYNFGTQEISFREECEQLKQQEQ